MRRKNGRYVPDKTATYRLSVKKSLHSRGLPRVYTSVAFLAGNSRCLRRPFALEGFAPFVSKWRDERQGKDYQHGGGRREAHGDVKLLVNSLFFKRIESGNEKRDGSWSELLGKELGMR